MLQMVIASVRWLVGDLLDGIQDRGKSIRMSFLIVSLAIGGHPGYAQSGPGQCSVSISSTASPAKYRAPVTITALLNGDVAADTVTGSVTLDGSALCSLAAGSSSCSSTLDSLTPGSHTIAWACTATGIGGSGQNSGSQQLSVIATRNFQMVLWDVADANVGLDADLAFIPIDQSVTSLSVGVDQPAQHSILHPFADAWLKNMSPGQVVPFWKNLLMNSDVSRIEAVLIDEPYLTAINLNSDPNKPPDTANHCLSGSTDPQISLISDAHTRLANIAGVIRELAPGTRFWINFSEPEAIWMQNQPACPPLDDTFVDVISLDKYAVDFPTGIQTYYNWFAANPSYPGQQMALTPGTFSRPETIYHPTAVADRLQGFFDYADMMNQSCNLPLGATGFTGNSDGCPVWMVGGWLFDTFTDPSGTTWYGEHDPASQAIAQAWQAEMGLAAEQNIHSGDALTITATDPF